jgi:predicted dehydrogenase
MEQKNVNSLRSSNKISISVAGSGPVAEYHLKILQNNKRTHPCGIYSNNIERVKYLARRYKLKQYGSLDELLADKKNDAVDICNANYKHYQTAKLALNAGKHVVIEKPVVFRSFEIADLIHLATTMKKSANAVFQKRYNRTKFIVENFIESQLDEILFSQTFVSMPRSREYYLRPEKSMHEVAGGGVLIYQAIHDLDLLLNLFGVVEQVLPITTNFFHKIDVEDTCFALLKFKSGVVSYLHASTIPGLPAINLHILYGRSKFIIFNNERVGVFPNRYLLSWQKYWKELNALDRLWLRFCRVGKVESFAWIKSYVSNIFKRQLTGIKYYGPFVPGSYCDVIEDFVTHIMRPSTSCITSLESTVEIHRIVEEIYGFENSSIKRRC